MTQVALTPVPAFCCNDCDEITADRPEGPLYECPECGTAFTRAGSYSDNHQCPQCRKFSSRVADLGCDSCGTGEVEEIEAYACPVCNALRHTAQEALDCCSEAAVKARAPRPPKPEPTAAETLLALSVQGREFLTRFSGEALVGHMALLSQLQHTSQMQADETIFQLRRLGLIEYSGRAAGDSGDWLYLLTPLGLEVRALLP